MVDCTTNSYAHHRPIPPWTARTGRRDIARGRIYSRLGRGPGGATDHHAARPTRRAHHCREVPRKGDTTATFSLQLERAKWAENQVRLMYGILKKGRTVCVPSCGVPSYLRLGYEYLACSTTVAQACKLALLGAVAR
jgi:hypothetical protein